MLSSLNKPKHGNSHQSTVQTQAGLQDFQRDEETEDLRYTLRVQDLAQRKKMKYLLLQPLTKLQGSQKQTLEILGENRVGRL